MQSHQISGEWTQADNTRHTLEVAPTSTKTENGKIFGLRSSEDQGTIVHATEQQLEAALNRVRGLRTNSAQGW